MQYNNIKGKKKGKEVQAIRNKKLFQDFWKNKQILRNMDCAGDGVQSRLPQNVPHWHIDYFELKLFNSQYKKGTLTFLCPPKSRK